MASSTPTFSFSTDSTTNSLAIPYKTYLSQLPDNEPNPVLVVVGAAVFASSTATGTSSPPRLLLLQRSDGKFSNGCWEIPGGSCDEDDDSILHSVARELWEETGLIAKRIGPQIGEQQVFYFHTGKMICKFSLMMEVELDRQEVKEGLPSIKLRSVEHQSYMWVTEDEVQARKGGDVELRLTTEEAWEKIVETFEMRRVAHATTTGERC